MSMDLSNFYQSEAKLAVKYTQQMLPLGAANKMSNQLRTLGTVNLGVANARVGNWAECGWNWVLSVEESSIDSWRRIAYHATRNGAGNCQEHAAVAFIYLVDRGVKPVEIVSVPNHAFVVVGRGQKPSEAGNVANPKDWADYCWVSDPWKGKVYQGKNLSSYEKGEPDLEAECRQELLRNYKKRR